VETIFDFLSVALFIAAASMFFYRFRNEDPALAPYMLISLSAAVANWLGNNGAPAGAIMLLCGGAFYLLHLAGAPYASDDEDRTAP